MSRLTNAVDHAAFVSTAPQHRDATRYCRSALAAAVALAIVAAFVAGHDAASAHAVEGAGPELTRLLRFMAVFKAALAAGAVWLVWWRSGYPVTLRLAMSYITACFLMAAGPGLVWSMAHVALGAVLVHAGLALLLAACWFDRGSTQDLVAALGERRARRRRETPPISAA